jgi:L-lactate dehydrogenase complex protein LldE
MRVNLFIPCFIDQFYPETALNTLRVLKKAGCTVEYNPQVTCCSQPLYNAGFWKEAKDLGEKFLENFNADIPVVTPSASCISMIKDGYNDLFKNTAQHNACRSLQSNIFELSEFLVNILGVDYFGAELEVRAMYHDSCSALRSCSIKDEPRRLLNNVAGFELVESPHHDVCCGFGGNFAVKHAAISTAMAAEKVEQALQLNAEAIVSTDASCLMHLQSYIDAQKIPIKTYHIADVLAAGWPNI